MPRTLTWKSPNPPLIGGAGADDPTWIVGCDLDQIRSLIQDPEKWMSELSTASGGQSDALQLISPFTMKIRLLPPSGPLPVNDDFLVGGINGTATITIRPIVRSENILNLVLPTEDVWSSYWRQWSLPAVPMHVSMVKGAGFGHLELVDPADPPEVRADKIAAFLIRGAFGFPRELGDPCINMIMEKTATSVSKAVRGAFADPAPTTGAFAPQTLATLANVDFVYIGEFGNDLIACDNMVGYVDENGQIVLDEVTVKSYAPVPPIPPVPPVPPVDPPPPGGGDD